MVSIRGSCLKLLQVTCSSYLGLALAYFSITISIFFYHACMFNSWRICARVGFTRDGEELVEEQMGRNLLPFTTCLGMRNSLRFNMDGLTEEQCRCVIHQGRIFCFLYGLLRILRKNFLLPRWGFFLFYYYYFFFYVQDSIGKNPLLPYWRHFGKESSASLLRICFNVLGSIEEISSASSMGMMLNMPELQRKSLLLPSWG